MAPYFLCDSEESRAKLIHEMLKVMREEYGEDEGLKEDEDVESV